MPGGSLLTPANNLFHLVPDRLLGDSHHLEGLSGYAFAFVDKAEQEVLGADVVMVERSCFFLGKDHYATGSVGKALKHCASFA
jgi:hypothetical protein